jgi:small redox-active disulfide protein 2
MLDVKVLGTGCANCKRTKSIISEVIQENHFDAQVVEVTDMGAIMAYGVMSTPAIVINEKVVTTGRVPAKSQVAEMIRQAQAA